MKNFTSVKDAGDLKDLLRKALSLKANPFQFNELGKNKTMGLVFFNPSLRTRLSSQRAAQNLGLNSIVYNAGQGWKLEFEDGVTMDSDKAEHVKEAAAVMSQYFDIISIRTFSSLTDRERDYEDFVLNKFIKYARVPVVSLESAIRHPLQSLADLMAIEEKKKAEKPKVVLSWAPHPKALPQAAANSFAEWMLRAEVDLTITHPEGFHLSEEFTKGAHIETNQAKAFRDADFIYAKNWSSFEDYGQVGEKHSDWTITPEKMALTKDAYFMHCLPVRRNVVAADAVLDSPKSLVIEQANNRTFAAQAVLAEILSNSKGVFL